MALTRPDSCPGLQVAILYSSSQNSLGPVWLYLKIAHALHGRNPLFIKSEFSRGILNLSKTSFWQGRNPLFIKSEFSRVNIWPQPVLSYGVSQSFIHQVRILSLFLYALNKREAIERASQSFIHQVRILSRYQQGRYTSSSRWGRNPLFIKSEFSHLHSRFKLNTPYRQGRNPLFIKSEFSLSWPYREICYYSLWNVAILYSSSQNSLWKKKK